MDISVHSNMLLAFFGLTMRHVHRILDSGWLKKEVQLDRLKTSSEGTNHGVR